MTTKYLYLKQRGFLNVFIFLLIACNAPKNKPENSTAASTKKEFDSCAIAKPFENIAITESSVAPGYTGELKNYMGADTTKLDFKHIFEKGKLVKSIFYYDNGQPQEEYCYKCGALQGPQKYYYKNGKLSKVIPFSYGYRQGVGELYDEAGTLRQQVIFVADSMIGEPKTFDKKGNLITSVNK